MGLSVKMMGVIYHGEHKGHGEKGAWVIWFLLSYFLCSYALKKKENHFGGSLGLVENRPEQWHWLTLR
jgi:hypothetical protein